VTENVPSPASSRQSSWTPAARLLRPQGRRGELLAEPLTDLPGLFVAGRRVSISAGSASPAPAAPQIETTLESCWFPTGRNAGRVVLKLVGTDTISAAELLAGRDLFVLTSDLPALEPDTWFVRDLLGCKLFDGATLIGEVTDVEYAMAADGRTRLPDAHTLLEVTRIEGAQSHPHADPATSAADLEPALIPFVKAWVDSVDPVNKRITMRLPPGLLDIGKSDPPPVNPAE
jgi:16S rRNA processing protein RimM